MYLYIFRKNGKYKEMQPQICPSVKKRTYRNLVNRVLLLAYDQDKKKKYKYDEGINDSQKAVYLKLLQRRENEALLSSNNTKTSASATPAGLVTNNKFISPIIHTPIPKYVLYEYKNMYLKEIAAKENISKEVNIYLVFYMYLLCILYIFHMYLVCIWYMFLE